MTSESDFNPWQALGVPLGGYNSEVDREGLTIMALMRRTSPGSLGTKDLAEMSGLSETHIELWQYILCSVGLCEYGTSPRYCWPAKPSEFDKFFNDWQAWYRRIWEETP